jgi:hypothetical protein
MNHNHADNRAKENISSEYSGCRYGNQYRQEYKSRIRHQVENAIPIASCKTRDRLPQRFH